MVEALTRNWWTWLIRGIAAVIFGILALLWPGLTWITIAIFFGAYALVDGIFAIFATIRAAEAHQRWWQFFIEGIVGILIAAITFYDIRIMITALYLTIAAWAFLTGILELVAAVQTAQAYRERNLADPRGHRLDRIRRSVDDLSDGRRTDDYLAHRGVRDRFRFHHDRVLAASAKPRGCAGGAGNYVRCATMPARSSSAAVMPASKPRLHRRASACRRCWSRAIPKRSARFPAIRRSAAARRDNSFARSTRSAAQWPASRIVAASTRVFSTRAKGRPCVRCASKWTSPPMRARRSNCLRAQPNLAIVRGLVEDLLVAGGVIRASRVPTAGASTRRRVVLATGTFLGGKSFRGDVVLAEGAIR